MLEILEEIDFSPNPMKRRLFLLEKAKLVRFKGKSKISKSIKG